MSWRDDCCHGLLTSPVEHARTAGELVFDVLLPDCWSADVTPGWDSSQGVPLMRYPTRQAAVGQPLLPTSLSTLYMPKRCTWMDPKSLYVLKAHSALTVPANWEHAFQSLAVLGGESK